MNINVFVSNAILRDDEAVKHFMVEDAKVLQEAITKSSDASAINSVMKLVNDDTRNEYVQAVCNNRHLSLKQKQPYVDELIANKTEEDILEDLKWNEYAVRDAIAARCIQKGPVSDAVFNKIMRHVGPATHTFEVIVGCNANEQNILPTLGKRNENLSFAQFAEFFKDFIGTNDYDFLDAMASHLDSLQISDDKKYAAYCLAAVDGSNFDISSIEYGRDGNGCRDLDGAISVYLITQCVLNQLNDELNDGSFQEGYELSETQRANLQSKIATAFENIEQFGRNAIQYDSLLAALKFLPNPVKDLIQLSPAKLQLNFLNAPDATERLNLWFNDMPTNMCKLVIANTLLSNINSAPDDYRDALQSLCENAIKQWEPNANAYGADSMDAFVGEMLSESWHQTLHEEGEPEYVEL